MKQAADVTGLGDDLPKPGRIQRFHQVVIRPQLHGFDRSSALPCPVMKMTRHFGSIGEVLEDLKAGSVAKTDIQKNQIGALFAR